MADPNTRKKENTDKTEETGKNRIRQKAEEAPGKETEETMDQAEEKAAEVKEKNVQLIELFNDLIYVYAVSRMTSLMEYPAHGIVAPFDLFRYLIACLTILQSWLYLTNYINRYGRWHWYEYFFSCVNMIGAMYLANTISLPPQRIAVPFNISMLVMLGSVAALYTIQIFIHPEYGAAAKNSLLILAIVCSIYAAGLILGVSGRLMNTAWINAAAVLVGAFLPFILRGRFSSRIISFPHLCERFEELTIVTFGEGIVRMAGFFDVSQFSLRPILVFLILICLFGCYVMQIHNLIKHFQTARSLILMFSHYIIVLAVSLITIVLGYVEAQDVAFWFMVTMASAALVLFFAALYANAVYYPAGVRLTKLDGVLTLASLLAGTLIMTTGKNHEDIFLCGMLFPCVILLLLLWRKDTLKKRQDRESPSLLKAQ